MLESVFTQGGHALILVVDPRSYQLEFLFAMITQTQASQCCVHRQFGPWGSPLKKKKKACIKAGRERLQFLLFFFPPSQNAVQIWCVLVG